MKTIAILFFALCAVVTVFANPIIGQTILPPSVQLATPSPVPPAPIIMPIELHTLNPQDVQRIATEWIATITVIVTGLSGLVLFIIAKYGELRKQIARHGDRIDQQQSDLVKVAMATPSGGSAIQPPAVGETTTSTTTTSTEKTP